MEGNLILSLLHKNKRLKILVSIRNFHTSYKGCEAVLGVAYLVMWIIESSFPSQMFVLNIWWTRRHLWSPHCMHNMNLNTRRPLLIWRRINWLVSFSVPHTLNSISFSVMFDSSLWSLIINSHPSNQRFPKTPVYKTVNNRVTHVA